MSKVGLTRSVKYGLLSGHDSQPSICGSDNPYMKTLKFNSTLTVGQRKLIAVLLLVSAFTNSHIGVARAADSASLADQAILSQVVLIDPDTTIAQDESITEPAAQSTVQDVLLRVCTARGYGQDCAKTLLGMLWNESSNISTAIGDGGRARGYFQIHYKLHNISIACAEDLVCSANWTLTYMEAHSYPKYVAYAVQCHNSCNVNNGYAARAFRHANYFWNKPLAINQAASIELAMK